MNFAPFRMNLFRLALPLLSGVLLSGCDMKQQLKEMHDSTANMEGYTKKMSDTTERMDGKTSQLHGTMLDMKELTDRRMQEMSNDTKAMKDQTIGLGEKTDTMVKTTTGLDHKMATMVDTTSQLNEKMGGMAKDVAGMREELQAARVDIKDMSQKMKSMSSGIQTIETVSREGLDLGKQGQSATARSEFLNNLREAREYGKKLIEARKFIVAFEYQLYTDGLGQKDGKREYLIDEAFQELFQAAVSFETSEIDPLADPSHNEKSNKQASFNALAAALHFVNRKQEDLHQDNSQVEVKSMYDMMMEALKEKNSQKQLSKAQEEILNHEKVAIQLLQARHNFIGTIILNNLTDLKKSWFTKIAHLLFPWKVDITHLNTSTVARLKIFAQYALKTRQDIQSLGITPEVDFKLNRLLKNALFSPSSMDKDKNWSEFQGLYAQLIQ